MTTDTGSKTGEVPRVLAGRELGDLLAVSPVEVIKELMKNGVMASINQVIDFDTAAIVASDLGFEAVETRTAEPTEAPAEQTTTRTVIEEDAAKVESRPPVVTIMGHVDHGKTSLLDAIRETKVTVGEAGGITQHIGAYQVHADDHDITFLDTPGHEAFTAMRARGARVTDVAVLVVAADDGVMPQTKEAIDHAKAAGVPIVVAVNKIDRPDANPERVRNELVSQGLQPSEWGGETTFVDVSAKAKRNLDDLLEKILLVADLELDPKANPTAEASGPIIESPLDVGRGPVATMLVHRGTLS